MPIHYQYIFHLSSYHVFPLKWCSCASDIKKEEGDCLTWRSTSKVLEKRGGAGEIRQHPTYIGCTTSDTKCRTDSSRLYPYFTGHTTSPTTQDLHSSKRYTDIICHSTSCTTEKSHSSKKYSKSTGRRPIPTVETANSCRLEPLSIYSQFKRQCFQCC